MSPTSTLVLVLGLAAGTLRWLRVMQREHYVPGSCTVIARLWIHTRAPNLALAVVAGVNELVLLVASAPVVETVAATVAGAIMVIFPYPLGIRGRDARLRWTRRLGTLAAVVAILDFFVFVVATSIFGGTAALGFVGIVTPLTVDLAARLALPVERLVSERYGRMARQKLASIAPQVVGITGSFGKTSTKRHLYDMLTGAVDVVASPASWNNQAGLSRTINEHLHPGAEVLIAEMGTYGLGEIRQLCEWLRPDIAIITAIGPMHLQRMGSMEAIVRAKAEILEGARVAVLFIDDPRLADLAKKATNPQVLRCGSMGQPDLDVEVLIGSDRSELRVQGAVIGEFDNAAGLHPGNVACAAAAAFALGHIGAVGSRLGSLSNPDHRGTTGVSAAGAYVIDNTFNSNPRGALAALDRLMAETSSGNRRFVVTPGFVELGNEQFAENEAFAKSVVAANCTLIIVGWTNRRALLSGAGGSKVVLVASRNEARDWIRSHVEHGDGVLWENDLPDQYP